LEFILEKLSFELDFVISDLFAVSKQTTETGEVRVLLKKEIESSVDSKILKKLFKSGFLETRHVNVDNQIRSCIFLTEKANEYCSKFHNSNTFVF
jgi:hypothetical protein